MVFAEKVKIKPELMSFRISFENENGSLSWTRLHLQDHMNDMKEEEYQKHVTALALKRSEKPKRLASEAIRHWSEISSRQYNFERGIGKPTCRKAVEDWNSNGKRVYTNFQI